MKFKFSYLLICLLVYKINYAQINLVPNSSFEDTLRTCSTQMGIGVGGSDVKNWQVNFFGDSPDYYNTCANSIPLNPINGSSIPWSCRGFQYPRTGNAYMGLGLYSDEFNPTDTVHVFSEYLGVQLNTPLKANTCYYAEMYINLANSSLQTVNQISMLFTNSNFTTTAFSFTNSIQPQVQYDTTLFLIDTLNWVKVSGNFIAQGGEQYLTIGNFRDGGHLSKKTVSSNFTSPVCAGVFRYAYIHIDDVSLYELPTPQLQSNAITICPNADTLVLGDTTRIHTRYQWFANGVPIDTTSYIKVKPSQTTTYVLQSTNCTTTTQSIVVTYSANCEPVVVVEPVIPNVFTPNNDSINDVWRFGLGKGNVLKDVAIFNRWGNLIYQKTNNLSQTTVLWDGRTTSGEETPSGVYFYVLQYTDPNGEEHKKNGYITLIK